VLESCALSVALAETCISASAYTARHVNLQPRQKLEPPLTGISPPTNGSSYSFAAFSTRSHNSQTILNDTAAPTRCAPLVHLLRLGNRSISLLPPRLLMVGSTRPIPPTPPHEPAPPRLHQVLSSILARTHRSGKKIHIPRHRLRWRDLLILRSPSPVHEIRHRNRPDASGYRNCKGLPALRPSVIRAKAPLSELRDRRPPPLSLCKQHIRTRRNRHHHPLRSPRTHRLTLPIPQDNNPTPETWWLALRLHHRTLSAELPHHQSHRRSASDRHRTPRHPRLE
jgi:hypothetical protein